MEKSAASKMDIDRFIAPVKLALDFLPEENRPNFADFVKKFKANVENNGVRQNFKGFQLIPSFTVENAEYQYENWNPNEGDVLISTYPKSGKYDFVISL